MDPSFYSPLALSVHYENQVGELITNVLSGQSGGATFSKDAFEQRKKMVVDGCYSFYIALFSTAG